MQDLSQAIHELCGLILREMPRLDAEHRAAQLFGAPELHLFSMFKPDERRITGIIADLLDPRGRHGQGALFLNTFLTTIGMPEVASSENVTVKVDELTCAGRLVDLMIRTDEAVVGVEVKIGARQQHEQLKDYCKHVDHEAGSLRKAMVFLADQEPETANDRVIRMPWIKADEKKSTLKWLWALPMRELIASTIPDIRAERTRRLMEEFVIWIDGTFGGEMMQNGEKDVYIDEVLKAFGDPNLKQALGAIVLAKDKLHEKVIDEIEIAMISALQGNCKRYTEDSLFNCLGEKYSSWRLCCERWPENAFIGLQADGIRFSSVFCGIEAFDGKDAEYKDKKDMICAQRSEIKSVIEASGESASDLPWWAWYQDMQEPYGKWDAEFAARILVEAPGGVIAKHPEIEKLISGMKKAAELLNKVPRT